MSKEISAEIRAMADMIKSEITINGKEGTATVTEKLFEKTLPDGMTIETVEKVYKHESDFIPSVTLAFGEHCAASMAKHKNVDSIELEIPIVGKNSYSISFDRSRVTHAPGKPEVDIVKYGIMSVEKVTQSMRAVGQQKMVYDQIRELSAAALSK